MNIQPAPPSEDLDRALVQCLRIFAQHGRRLRKQEKLLPGQPAAQEMPSPKQDNSPDNKVEEV